MRYNFTSKYLHTSSHTVYAIEVVVYLLFWVVSAITVFMLLPYALTGALPHIVALGIVFALVVLLWLLIWYVFRCVARVLGEAVKSGLVPLYMLVRPFTVLYYSLRDRGSKKSNFTWQHLR